MQVVTYVSDDGLLQGLPENPYALSVMVNLFGYSEFSDPVHGRAVIANCNEARSLTKTQEKRIACVLISNAPQRDVVQSCHT